MKTKISFSILFLSLFVVGTYASEQIPILVSPGSEVGIAVVGEVCPTFSWTAVEGSVAYRVEIFNAIDNMHLTYEEMVVVSYPVLTKQILGAATSWTPSSYQRLAHNGIYVWYVQAIDTYGVGAWSKGATFKVDMALSFSPIEETVSETLDEHGVSKDIIGDVLNEMRQVPGRELDRTRESQEFPKNLANRFSILGNEVGPNTYYGQYTGASLTTGGNNTFIGQWAGSKTTSGWQNVFLGYQAGTDNTSGGWNSFVGSYSGNSNTTGGQNTFIGFSCGTSNSTGAYNTFVGYQSGLRNTSSHYNTFIGGIAGYRNTVGYENTFVGFQAGYNNVVGFKNTFMGYSAGFSNTANYNTFIGHFAGNANTSGYANTIIGREAGYSSTTGNLNTFLGHYSGRANTTGYSNTFLGERAGYTNVTGYENTFVGRESGYANTTGSLNTFLGRQSGNANTIGGNNTFVGYKAGQSNTTGFSNMHIGNLAGQSCTTGIQNTSLGSVAGANNVSGSGNVFLGYRAGLNETSSNKLYIDNSDTSSPLIYGNFNSDTVAFMGTVGVGTKSPAFPMEMKKTGTNASIVVDRTDGATNYINATDTSGNFGTVTNHVLRLVVNSVWRMRLHTDDSLTMKSGASCSAGGTWTNASSRDLKENISELSSEDAFAALEDLNPVQYNYKADKEEDYVGFIAEDVPDLVASKDRKGMSPMDVVAVLTKVLQEQQKLNQEQLRVNEELRAEIAELREKLSQDR
jgi:hypothetical protein